MSNDDVIGGRVLLLLGAVFFTTVVLAAMITTGSIPTAHPSAWEVTFTDGTTEIVHAAACIFNTNTRHITCNNGVTVYEAENVAKFKRLPEEQP